MQNIIRLGLDFKAGGMFSNFIQNLLNTGGQAQAMQRYAQLSSKVNNLNASEEPQNPLDAIYPNNGKINSPSFEKSRYIISVNY